MNVIDNAIAVRIIYLLTLPFEKWEAFKDGFIDADGERNEKPMPENYNDWSMLHRLVCRLKKLLGKLPAGKSSIASITAAYLLVKEGVEQKLTLEEVEDNFNNKVNENVSFKSYQFVTSTLKYLNEEGEAPSNSITGVAGIKPGEEPPGPKKRKKVKNDTISSIRNT